MVVPFVFPLLPGAARFWMLNTLNASKRSCNCLLSVMGNFLKKERSMLTTCALLRTLRPKFPNDPTGTAKAQGLNQLSAVFTKSAACPPWELVFWHSGSGLEGTGPALKGSAIKLGRA